MSTQLSYSLRHLLEKEKLARNGANFLDWHRNLRLALRLEEKEYLLTTLIPAKFIDSALADKKGEYDKHIKDEKSIHVLIVDVMEPELQKEFTNCGLDVMEIVDHLKNMFQEKSRVEKAKLTKAIANTRLAEGKEVGPHVMKMASYFRQLEKLEVTFIEGVAQDFILNSLPSNYSGFVMNY
jgi:gag-polypeptide of LTR copia-type